MRYTRHTSFLHLKSSRLTKCENEIFNQFICGRTNLVRARFLQTKKNIINKQLQGEQLQLISNFNYSYIMCVWEEREGGGQTANTFSLHFFLVLSRFIFGFCTRQKIDHLNMHKIICFNAWKEIFILTSKLAIVFVYFHFSMQENVFAQEFIYMPLCHI